MVPAIVLPVEDDAVAGEVEGFICEVGKGVFVGVSAAEDLLADSGRSVCHINRPWSGTHGNDGQLYFAAGRADEGDRFSVRRPAWRAVAIDARRHIMHGLGSKVIDHDEVVVAAVEAEEQLLAVRRPFLF